MHCISYKPADLRSIEDSQIIEMQDLEWYYLCNLTPQCCSAITNSCLVTDFCLECSERDELWHERVKLAVELEYRELYHWTGWFGQWVLFHSRWE